MGCSHTTAHVPASGVAVHACPEKTLLQSCRKSSCEPGKKSSRSLREAVKAGDVLKIKILLRSGASPFCVDKVTRTTLLHLAASNGHIEVAECLLASGVSIQSKDFSGLGPLHDAVHFGHTQMTQLLLDFGADVNAVDMQSMTPLHHAAKMGRVEIAELLLHRGADLNAKSVHGYTPLALARDCSFAMAAILEQRGDCL